MSFFRNPMVMVWHNMEWLPWKDRDKPDASGMHNPLCEALSGNGNLIKLFVKLGIDHSFGPAGETASNWNFLLPRWVSRAADGTFQVRSALDDGAELRVTSLAAYDSWLFDSEGELVPEKPSLSWTAAALQIGCATFAVVFAARNFNRRGALVDKLHRFFTRKFESELSKALGLSGRLLSKPQQLHGLAGTYLVTRTTETRLGEGYSSKVHKGIGLETERVLAFKFLDRDVKSLSIDDLATREKRNLKLLKHEEHVVQVQDFCASDRVMVMEYIPHGQSDHLYDGRRWPTTHLLKLSKQICDILDYMHSELNMAHKDIHPGNILIKRKEPLRVVLLGFSHASTSVEAHGWGHRGYRAPETHGGTATAHCQADIWSLGVTVLELALGERFRFGGTSEEQREDLLARFKEEAPNLNAALRKLLRGMLRLDPGERWDAYSCLQYLETILNSRSQQTPRISDQVDF